MFSHRAALAAALITTVCAIAPSLAQASDMCVKDAACVLAGNIPYPTLADALSTAEVAPDADRIFIGAGTFTAPTTDGYKADFNPVELIGAGRDQTTLTGPTDTTRVLAMSNAASGVSHLSIVIPDQNNARQQGGLLMVGATAKDLSITSANSPTAASAGAYLYDGAELVDSVVSLPLVSQKDGLQLYNDTRIENVDVTAGRGLDVLGANVQVDRAHVTAKNAAAWAAGLNDRITNSVLRGGASGLYTSDNINSSDVSVTVRNVTIAGDSGYGVVCNSSAHNLTVIVDSTTIHGSFHRSPTAPGTANVGVSYSDYDPSTVTGSGPGAFSAGIGNINSDPLFTSPTDVHLLGGSPLIDAGDPGSFNDTVDVDGNPRVVNGRRDIGAIEAPLPTPTAPASGSAPPSDPAATAPVNETPTVAPMKDLLAPTITGLKVTPVRMTARRRGQIGLKVSEAAKLSV